MTQNLTHLEEIRLESEVIADAIEDNEDVVRACTGDCDNCPHDKFQTCFN